MKLYTEEQVKHMIIGARLLDEDDTSVFTEDYLISRETPIELPSDEEIYDKSNTIDLEGLSWEVRLARDFFNEGAKWVIEQIRKNAH